MSDYSLNHFSTSEVNKSEFEIFGACYEQVLTSYYFVNLRGAKQTLL